MTEQICIKEVILGKVPSKSNMNRVITINGHGSIGKTETMKAYERSFMLQCRNRKAGIKGFFKLTADVFYENNRPDLDNSLKVILDCLQMCGVILNDRNCIEIHARKFVDKTNPRVEITIEG